MAELNYKQLRNAVSGGAVAIRSITRLQPAGGAGDKVFPPSYTKEKRGNKYAFETRRIDGQDVQVVLLDSVASQANRMEEALLEGYHRQQLSFPLIRVDFSESDGLEDLEQISSLQAPHRVADALLRDSELDGVLFRTTDVGRAITDSRPNHATGMFKYCPTALLYGVWDSTGPKGGMGSKFQRCVVSEIVGIGAIAGVKVGSRLDPLGIEKSAGPVYHSKNPEDEWTHEPGLARLEKKKPAEFSRSGQKDKGSPSTINHGNIPPSVDVEAGGVTCDYAEQVTVLTIAGLRRLRFSQGTDGRKLSGKTKYEAEDAGRAALAALALAGIVFQRDNGFDLRSRSLLIPEGPLELELLDRDGKCSKIALSRDGAAKLLRDASTAAAEAGLSWHEAPIDLTPANKLEHLVRVSRSKTVSGEAGD